METINELAKALAAAQAEMQNPSFDSQNPHFQNRFASLAAVRNAVIPVLAKHGIAVIQNLESTTAQTPAGVSCFTTLLHSSGQQWTSRGLFMPASKADAQGLGSSATYVKRYQLMAVCGVVGDMDDDAEAAVNRPGEKMGPRPDKTVPVDRARELATRMRGILESDATDDRVALAVADLHDELNKNQDEYIAAADQLNAKERRGWKEYLRVAKAAQNDPLNGGAHGHV